MPMFNNRVAGGGAWEQISSTTIGSAVQNLDLTGFDLDAGFYYKIIGVIYQASGGAVTLDIFFNADYTATNYYSQSMVGNTSTPTCARTNNSLMGTVPTAEATPFEMDITKLASREAKISGVILPYITSSINRTTRHIVWGATNVTTVRLAMSGANGMGVGSKIRVLKLKA